MGRSKGAAARSRKADAARKANAPKIHVAEATKIEPEPPRPCPSLVPDVLANIHGRLGFLDRVAFAAVFTTSCGDDLFMPDTPWLVFPSHKPATVQLFSVADRRGATVPAPEPALRGHLVLGSSRGWLATADDRGQIYLVNPATGEQHELPHMSTIGIFHPSTNKHYFTLDVDSLLTIRYGHGPPFNHVWCNTFTWPSDTTCTSMYRKVVLSPSPRRNQYAAMLIWNRDFGAPAFSSAEDPTWRLAPSHDGVEDAIHHGGKFYSVSYAGLLKAWEREAESGSYTSTAVAPRLAMEEDKEPSCRKYVAVSPSGQLMVVIKYTEQMPEKSPFSFRVHVLRNDGQWNETTDVGDMAVFVGMNNSLCVPTIGRPQIKRGCIYHTDDLVEAMVGRKKALASSSYVYSSRHNSDLTGVWVYSLMDGTLKEQRSFYPPPVCPMIFHRSYSSLLIICSI
ncbi:unnamed protein product [Alopecurus aequalis]